MFISNIGMAKVKHTETITIKVYGNCEMCKKRIETALLKNSNVKQAIWNVDTKIATITFDPHALNADAVQKLIADAGHDTEKLKANNKTYNALPECCQYERAK